MKTRVTAILPSGEKQYDTSVSLKSLMCYMVGGDRIEFRDSLDNFVSIGLAACPIITFQDLTAKED